MSKIDINHPAFPAVAQTTQTYHIFMSVRLVSNPAFEIAKIAVTEAALESINAEHLLETLNLSPPPWCLNEMMHWLYHYFNVTREDVLIVYIKEIVCQ